MLALLLALVCCLQIVMVRSEVSTFELPSSMLGTWAGIPDDTPLGPFQAEDEYRVGISQADNGDFLIDNNLLYGGLLMGWQRFYVEGTSENAGELWYCGQLNNFSNFPEQAGIIYPDDFAVESQSDTHVTWCLDTQGSDLKNRSGGSFPTGCKKCNCANWTLALMYDNDEDSNNSFGGASNCNPGLSSNKKTASSMSTPYLQSIMSTSGSPGHTHSRHLSVAMTRVGPPPVLNQTDWPSHGANFSCNFNGTANVPVDFDDSQTNMNLPAEATPDDHHHSHDFDRHSSSMSGDGFTSSGSSSCPFLRRQSKPPAHLHTPPSSSSGLAQNVDGKAMEAGVLDGEVQVKGAKKQRSGDFNHCYVLNGATNYQLAWSLRRSSEAGKEQGSFWLDVSVTASVPSSDSWIAIGFRPQSRHTDPTWLDPLDTGRGNTFGMAGADIVAGFGSGDVQILYASLYTGPPQVPDPPESALEVFNYSATFTPDPAAGSRGDANTTTSSGTLSLGFTRAVAGTGNLAYHGLASDQTTVLSPWADLIWAVGDSEPTATCEKGKNELLRKGLDRKARNDLQQSKAAVGSHELLQGEGLSYHSNTRGLRVIPWQNPEKYLVDSWKC